MLISISEFIEKRRIQTNQSKFRQQVARPVNTRGESRPPLDDSSESEIDKNNEFTYDQMNSLRSELFNINKRLKRTNNFFYQNSRQQSTNIIDSFENAGVTRPSTNGFGKGELDPIDHEKSKLKLKLLLQNQLKNATGQYKLELERRLAQIDHPSIRVQDVSDCQSNFESNKVTVLC